MFLKRDKKIVLHCYTARSDVYNYFPITDASKTVPKWFKKLPRPYFNSTDDFVQNLKQCSAFLNYFSTGFTMPLWSDLSLVVGEEGTVDYKWQYSDHKSNLNIHFSDEWGNALASSEYQHFKLESPWLFSCEENISFLAVKPDWQLDKFKGLDSVHVLSGILEFKSQTSTNINMFVKRMENKENALLIDCGTPIYRFIPLTEREVVIKTHLVSLEHFEKIKSKSTTISFFNSYAKKKKLVAEKKCPFRHEITE
jgi:hypothetical protein